MKRSIVALVIMVLLFTLTGCFQSGYIKSTDGDITVSLPEFTYNDSAFVIPEEAKVILGKWNLVSITTNGNEQTFENSYYVFYDDGNVTLKVGEQQDTKQKYKFVENKMYIANSPVTYTVENDTLTITTSENKIHKLTKIAE